MSSRRPTLGTVALDAVGETDERAADTAAGMAWWNAQSEVARCFWLERTGPGACVADAWAEFKRCRGRKGARL